jgi:ribosomal-protein-alanine N-acetyltransferase
MITFRDAIALDLPVLVGIEKKLFADSPWSMGQFKEEFAGMPKTRFFTVATNEENQIIGYAGVLLVAPGVEADVLTVAVLPQYQKQGIATQFMERLEGWAREKQSPAMMLEVGIENVPAIDLYKKLGYTNISARPNYYGHGLDAYVMRKELSHE